MLNEGFITSKDRTVWVLTVLMFSSFFLFEMKTWGKYLFLFFIIAIAIAAGGRFSFTIERFQKHTLVFAAYCFLTAIWAWIPANALQSGLTIVEITICFSFLYVYYRENENISLLLSAIKWGGYIVSIYAIIYYGGFSAISAASQESDVRLVNSFSNINEIGMLAAIACIFQVNEYFGWKKITWHYIFLIPSVMIVAASQSRKAFILLILGILMLAVLKNIGEKFSVQAIFKIVALLIVAVALIYLVQKLGIFSGTIGRLTETSESSNGSFFYDPNTLRGQYKLVGWYQFLKNPIGGIGISSSTQMIKEVFGRSTYTHDNYIELLSCGGIIGFIIYYSMYVYLFAKLTKYRKYDTKYADICLILLILLLIADTALVSYSSKERYIYLMMFFIESARIDYILENGEFQ